MKLSWREASEADLALLSEWNHQLIRDEGHRNPMTVAELADRMKKWLRGEYHAVIFSARSRLLTRYTRMTMRSSIFGSFSSGATVEEPVSGGAHLRF